MTTSLTRLARAINAPPPPSTITGIVTATGDGQVTVIALGASVTLTSAAAVNVGDRVLIDVTGNRWGIARTL